MTTSLFIGRFQPFQLGHLDAVKQNLKKCSKIIIAVGSSQYSNQPGNPFSFEERKKMIESALKAENISDYTIIPIEDINDNEKWVDCITDKVPEYDYVFTGNPLTEKLFLKKKHRVEKLEFHIQISATDISKMVCDKNHKWKDYIHPSVLKILEEIDAEQRIKEIYNDQK